jgi:DNA-binding transcriptional LysR family regulator
VLPTNRIDIGSALKRLGNVMASTVMFQAEVTSGRLVPLQPDYTLEPVEAHALFPGGSRPSTKIRALVDYLADSIRTGPMQ